MFKLGRHGNKAKFIPLGKHNKEVLEQIGKYVDQNSPTKAATRVSQVLMPNESLEMSQIQNKTFWAISLNLIPAKFPAIR